MEQTQQDTRHAWIAEKRKREAIQQELDDLKNAHAEHQQQFKELDDAHTVLRRQAIASRYDAWSGRKIGVSGDPNQMAAAAAMMSSSTGKRVAAMAVSASSSLPQLSSQRPRPKSRG